MATDPSTTDAAESIMPAALNDKVQIDHEEIVMLCGLTDEELQIEKTLVRKIDIRILPVIVLIYIMNYIDRYIYILPSS